MFSDRISVKNANKKMFDFWTKRHVLTPLKNVHYLTLFNTSVKKKKVIREISIFGQNPWTNPF